MKKVFLGLSIFVSTLLCEELTQYEAVQKLNDVSGRLIVEQQSIKNDLAIIKSGLEEGDRVVVSDITKLRNNLLVNATVVENKIKK